jgi:hypothetical protein
VASLSLASPQPHDTAVPADPDAVAVAERRGERESQPIDVGREFDGGADDLTGLCIRTQARIIVADAKLLALPRDDERVGCLHAARLTVKVRQLAWHTPLASLPDRRGESRLPSDGLVLAGRSGGTDESR